MGTNATTTGRRTVGTLGDISEVAAESGRITKDPDVRRVEIMATAMELFTKVGYKKASVQMITEKVGVAKGLFYHYFESKADLLDQIARWQTEIFWQTQPRHASEMDGDALEKLRAMIGMIVQWKFENLKEFISTYMHVMFSDENAPLRVALVNEYTYAMAPLLGEILAEGVEEGVCDVDDPETTARLMFSMWVGGSDHMAKLLMDLPENPENIDLLLAHIRAWESGVERLAGIEPGTLELYDYDFLRTALTDVALSEGGGR